MTKNKNIFIYIFLFSILLIDFSFSFNQYLKAPIDGDLVAIVLPGDRYRKVLHDPLGLDASIHNKSYPGTNRFTAHATQSLYFKTIPIVLQSVFTPINSIYVAAALARIGIHIVLVALLGLYISSLFNYNWREGLIGAVLVSPFFQGFGLYTEYMGIIDYAVTYAMFYALPITVLLIFLFPFYKSTLDGKSVFSFWMKPLWTMLMLYLVFFGPLPAPILIILLPLSILIIWFNTYNSMGGDNPVLKAVISIKQINIELLVFFCLTIILCLYSMYVGTKNSENHWTPLSLINRYQLLQKGIIDCFFNYKTGLLYVLIALTANMFLLKMFLKKESKLFFKIALFICAFSIIYILLLPMGGYRLYRPLIIRRDTILPVLILIYFCWGVSSIMLLNFFNNKKNYVFAAYLCLFSLFYFLSDEIPNGDKTNWNEKIALNKIANSHEPCIALERDCTIMNWSYEEDCINNANRAEMLLYWNITSKKTEFHQPEIK